VSVGATALPLRWDLLRELIVRDVRLRYRGKVLGLLWSQFAPLVSVIIFSLLFSRVIPLGIPNYPLFILIGVETWQWFQTGLIAGATSVTGNRDLVRHPGFPVAVLPSFVVGVQLTQFALALPVIVGSVVVMTGRLPVTAVWLPVILLVQFVLCIGGAYLLAALQVFLRDTAEIVGVVLRLAFFATPIIYDEQRLAGSSLHLLLDVNPMAHLITAQRDVLLTGREPDLVRLGVVAVFAALVAWAGLATFRRLQHRFPDEV
jgi:homopolymeric O-antigen transport system permease protein